MRSYQILTIAGSLFVIYDLIFAARQISISILLVNVYAIISVFLFRNNTKPMAVGLIVLTILMLYAIGNFYILKFRQLEMAFFVAGAITAFRYRV